MKAAGNGHHIPGEYERDTMSDVGIDTSDKKFAEYAHPEVIVSTAWLEENLENPQIAIVESDEDPLLYESGHIPGAIKIDWLTELNDPFQRDYLDSEGFAALLSDKGIDRDQTIVLYGDKSNWWATYAFWVFKLFGHEDVRILDGGRAKWIAEDRLQTTDLPERATTEYPVVDRNEDGIRAFRDDILSTLGTRPLIDVRSPAEYAGETTTAPDYPEESALKPGHIPTANNIPWKTALAEDEGYLPVADLKRIYVDDLGLKEDDHIVAYCRIGERSSHTWFALKYLLGFDDVKNYDGSWTEWGSLVKAPIAHGDRPGEYAR
jgi:Rhodanese-related sulfurtransferase